MTKALDRALSSNLPDVFCGIANHGLSVSASAGALTINLTDNAGSTPSTTSPVIANFRNSTDTSGSRSKLLINSALSLVIPATATLATPSAKAFRLWVVLFNDNGTPRLGVINCSTYSFATASMGTTTIYPLDEYAAVSSALISTSATSAGVFYTGAAVTSKAFVIVGFVEWGASGLTAGTWTTTNLVRIQSFGYGIHKPGDIVQQRNVQTNATVTSTSTSYVSTGLAASITPKSACNPIRIRLDGGADQSDIGTTTSFDVNRDAQALAAFFSRDGLAHTTKQGSNAQYQPVFFQVHDFPNTANAIAYTVMWKMTGNTCTFGARNGGLFAAPVSYAVHEIMG